MLKLKSSPLTVAVVAATVLILAAGGAAVASNMAFKINMVLVTGGNNNVGKNDLSIPYFNPYTQNCTTGPGTSCFGALCAATGLPGGLGGTTAVTLNENTGIFDATVTCQAAGATTGPAFSRQLIPGKGVRVRPPTTWPVGGSIIIVGSHNPSLQVTVPDAGAGQIGRLWHSVPYHTTAVTTRDFCLQAGLSNSGIGIATITILNPNSPGTFQNASCSANPGLTLPLGRFIQITEPQGPRTFTPAHF